MLPGTLGTYLLGNQPTGKGIYKSGQGITRAEEGFLRGGQGTKKKALMPPHSLTNLEIQNYYKNEPRFNGVYSRDNLPKIIKNGAYVINLDEYTVLARTELLCM